MSGMVTAVLSGGGVKAAAQVGALEVLVEHGLVPTRYVGTSMGAVVAAVLAGGLSLDETIHRLGSIRRERVAAIDRTAFVTGIFARSFLRGAPLRETLGSLLPVARFSDLLLPLSVVTTDLDTGDLVVFGAGGEDAPLADVLAASCALPVFYPAVEIGGRRLADGGLRAVLALEIAARFPADHVVAIDVGPGFDSESSRDRSLPALLAAHNDAQHILMASNTALQVALWRATPGRPPLLYLRPRVHRGETFAVERVDEYRDEGRRAAREMVANGFLT